MVIGRLPFFLLVLLIVLLPFASYTFWWLAHSAKINGVMWYRGKSYTGQIAHEYSAVKFIVDHDTAWFNTSDNIIFKPGEIVPVRYQVSNHNDAKADIFIEIWGNSVIYGGVLALIIVISFLHPSIIPRRSKLRISLKKPFIEIV